MPSDLSIEARSSFLVSYTPPLFHMLYVSLTPLKKIFAGPRRIGTRIPVLDNLSLVSLSSGR
jgi:hypothetical protein